MCFSGSRQEVDSCCTSRARPMYSLPRLRQFPDHTMHYISNKCLLSFCLFLLYEPHCSSSNEAATDGVTIFTLLPSISPGLHRRGLCQWKRNVTRLRRKHTYTYVSSDFTQKKNIIYIHKYPQTHSVTHTQCRGSCLSDSTLRGS